ncbi:NADH-quinone oxidoreductase subunit J [Bacteroidales bacterium AH-315-N07]|nr:NADH-quinone oxidoreductase subunit J [Bacteroidales bacterium AH-315-N07]
MSITAIIFYILSISILTFAFLTVTTSRIYRAAIYLLGTLISIAGLYFYLNYQFIGAVQIALYVGGIVVLIIFSVFLTHQSGSKIPRSGLFKNIASAAACALGFYCCFSLISEYSFTKTTAPAIVPNINTIGLQLMSLDNFGYILPFEVISILLLASLIGCIVIAIRIK